MSKQPQLCDLPGSGRTHGLCCTSKQNHTTKDFFIKHSKLRSNDDDLVHDVFRDAKMEFKMMTHREENHKPIEISSSVNHPGDFHQMVFG